MSDTAGQAGAGTATAEDEKKAGAGAAGGGAGAAGGAGGDGGQGGAQDWRAGLPDTLKEGIGKSAKAQTFKGEKMVSVPEELVKSFMGQEELLGKKGIIKPGKDSPKEDWDKFHTEMGRPAKAEEYALPKLEGVDEKTTGMIFPEHVVKSTQEKFFEKGYSQEQYQGAMQIYADMELAAIKRQNEDAQAKTKSTEAALRKDWGADYDKNLAAADRWITKNADPEDKEFIELFRHSAKVEPRLARMLAKSGKLYQEDAPPAGGAGGGMGAEAAKVRIEEINAKLAGIKNPHDPELNKLLAEREQLYAVTVPQKKK